MFRRLLLIAAAGMLIATAGARTLEVLEGAYEAVLGDVRFPSGSAGTLTVRMCPTCEARYCRQTPPPRISPSMGGSCRLPSSWRTSSESAQRATNARARSESSTASKPVA